MNAKTIILFWITDFAICIEMGANQSGRIEKKNMSEEGKIIFSWFQWYYFYIISWKNFCTKCFVINSMKSL